MTGPRAVISILGAGLVLPLVLTLSACGPGSPVPPDTPSAGDPACTSLISRLPQRLLGAPRGSTGLAGVAVWGDPAIVLRCGLVPPGPSTKPCIGVDGVDWLFSEDKDTYYFDTFGRRPAVELTIPSSIDRTTAPGALAELSAAIGRLPVTGQCVNPDGT
jgi:hypothetical protein